MVWASFCNMGVCDIHFIEGTLTGEKYASILENQYYRFVTRKLDADIEDFILVEDNDKKHTSKPADDMRQSLGIDRLTWPA